MTTSEMCVLPVQRLRYQPRRLFSAQRQLRITLSAVWIDCSGRWSRLSFWYSQDLRGKRGQNSTVPLQTRPAGRTRKLWRRCATLWGLGTVLFRGRANLPPSRLRFLCTLLIINHCMVLVLPRHCKLCTFDQVTFKVVASWVGLQSDACFVLWPRETIH